MGAGFNFIDHSLRVLTPFLLILLFWFTLSSVARSIKLKNASPNWKS